jgi:Spy/CpxP family protein refolding chaperone
MRKTLIIAAVVLLVMINVTALTTIAYHRWFKSGESPAAPPHDHRRAMAFLRHALSLTDEQIEQLREKRREMEEKTRDLHAQLHEKRQALMQLMKTAAPDETEIDRLIEDIGSIQIALEKEVIRHMLQERNIFTSQQREKFLFLFESHFHRRFMRGGPGPRGKHGPPGRPHPAWNPDAPERRKHPEQSKGE